MYEISEKNSLSVENLRHGIQNILILHDIFSVLDACWMIGFHGKQLSIPLRFVGSYF